MNYYILKPAVDTPDTGPIYPQIQKMSKGYDYKAANSVHALSRCHDSFPNYSPNLDYFILHNRAKMTDLFSVAILYGGFLVREKFKKVLESFVLPDHRFYNAKVFFRKKFHECYWMHLVSNLTDAVDYPASSFFTFYNYTYNLGNIDVSSYEDLLLKRRKIKADNPGKSITIWSEKSVLNNSFNDKLDLFEIGSFDSKTYISGQLKQAIQNEKITGAYIEETKRIITK